MIVLINRRIVAKQYELIGVPPIAESCHCLAAQLLPCRCEPSLRPLPRGIIAVKLVRPERAITPGKKQVGHAWLRSKPAFGRRVLVSVVAFCHESRGEIPLCRYAHPPS